MTSRLVDYKLCRLTFVFAFAAVCGLFLFPSPCHAGDYDSEEISEAWLESLIARYQQKHSQEQETQTTNDYLLGLLKLTQNEDAEELAKEMATYQATTIGPVSTYKSYNDMYNALSGNTEEQEEEEAGNQITDSIQQHQEQLHTYTAEQIQALKELLEKKLAAIEAHKEQLEEQQENQEEQAENYQEHMEEQMENYQEEIEEQHEEQEEEEEESYQEQLGDQLEQIQEHLEDYQEKMEEQQESQDDQSEETDVKQTGYEPDAYGIVDCSEDDSSDEIDDSYHVVSARCLSRGLRPYPGDLTTFLRFNGYSWTRLSCPPNMGFSPVRCTCCIYLPETTTTTTTSTTTTPETTTTTSTTTPPPTTTTTSTTTTTTKKTTPTPTTTTTTERTTTPTTTPVTITTPKPNLELCNDCVILHGVGYAALPGICHAFVQCRYYGDVPTTVNIVTCPSGLYWNQDKLTCDYPSNVDCTPVNYCPNHKAIEGDETGFYIFKGYGWERVNCPSGWGYSDVTCGCTKKLEDTSHISDDECLDKKAIEGDPTGFLQLAPSGWIRMPCPATTGYDEDTCRCTKDLGSDYKINPVCPDLKPIPGDKTGFYQLVSENNWVRMPCPATLEYNPLKCICDYPDNVDSVDVNGDDKCKPSLKLEFEDADGTVTDSSINKFWVNNTGVTVQNGKAFFNGQARLVVPGFSNMELGSTLYILVQFRQTSLSSPQTVVSNGDCDERQSLGMCAKAGAIEFYAETDGQAAPVLLTVPKQTGSWQYAMYVLDKAHLQGYVGSHSGAKQASGGLQRRHRGLVIGGGGNCDNFRGLIDEVVVYKCKPDF